MVVDPQRDIDRVLDLVAAERGVRITHVLETHVHNDYVTGGLRARPAAPARATLLPGRQRCGVRPHRRRRRRRGRGRGEMRVRVLHTPGHTHHHVSYVLTDVSDNPAAVAGGVHRRVDALRRHRTHRPGRSRVDRGADPRPVPLGAPAGRRAAREAAVLPTHGFGSFCSATPTSGDASTVGEQARVNPALTLDEQDYVDTLLAGLDAYPAYYAHMGPINRPGPAPGGPVAARAGGPRRAAPADRGRRVGGRPAGAHARSPPGTWPGRSGSSWAPTSSPTWAGSTATAPR